MRLITLLLVLAMVSAGPACAAVLNVMDYGAKADGKTDDTAAFNKALADAAKTPGSTVLAPSGKYLIAGSIGVPFHTTLKGEYQGPSGTLGTTLLATGGKGKADGPACIGTSGWSGVMNLEIVYPDQDANAKEPIPYGWAIVVSGCSRVENVLLYNAYQGLLVDEAPTSIIRDVWGEPLKVGMRVDHILDICRIENVHFTPLFTNGKPMREWVQKNSVAFEFGRTDWIYCFNTFCYGYGTGYRFFKGEDKGPNRPAGLTNGNFLGIGADASHYAIDVEDCYNIGVSITNGEFVSFAGDQSRGVLLRKGNTGNLTLSNCNFWAMSSSVAEVHDGSLNLSACNISDWGQSFWKIDNPKVPCLIVDGGRLNVNGCTFNRGGLLAVIEGKAPRALFTGNMGTEPLTVVGGTRQGVVTGTNDPQIQRVLVNGEFKPPPAPGKRAPIPEMPDH